MGDFKVSLGYGKVNLSETLATYACMVVKPPFQRQSAVTAGAQVGRFASNAVGRDHFNGAILTGEVNLKAGSILIVQSRWSRFGASFRDGAMFFRLRAGAPYWQAQAKVPVGRDNVFGNSFVIFAGHADLLSPTELRLLGIEVPRSWSLKFLDTEELEECFSLTQLVRETVPKPGVAVIATPTGIELREVAAAPRRRLILRSRDKSGED